jgi:DNA (cytosine-5)-methyltransferase 1
VDCRNATENPEVTGALQADAAHNLNSNNVVRIQYIVRRLTPTECARLQGFADWWGHIEEKKAFTDEEYRFWHDVRNTHAEINGKKVQEYTEKQMLTWYNKLHTDASEYKLWGNGIALPNALYVMQGIADVYV